MSQQAINLRGGSVALVLMCAGALVAGWSVATGHWVVLLPLLVLPILMALRIRAWAPYTALVLAVSSVAWVYAYPRLFVGSRGVFGSEILLVMCLIAIFMRARSNERTPLTGYVGTSVALGVFLCSAMVGVFVASANGTPTSLVLSAARPMAFYLSFWVALAAMKTPRLRRSVVAILGAVACSISVLQIAQALIGVDHTLFVLGSYTMQVAADPTSGGFLRIRPPGLTLVYVAAVMAAAYLLWGPPIRRLVAAGVLGVCGTGILLSLNRNMILGVIVGLAAAGVVARQRGRFVIGVLVSVLVIGAVVAVVSSESWVSKNNRLVERMLTLADVRGLQGGSLDVRAYENGLARKVLRRQWLGGIGWGTSYGATLPVFDGQTYVFVDRPWVHNQYYSMWLRTGVVGFVALLIALGLALWHACRELRHPQVGSEAWMAAGAVAALVALMASAAVGLYFSEPASIVPLAGVMALAIALDAPAPDSVRTCQSRDVVIGGPSPLRGP